MKHVLCVFIIMLCARPLWSAIMLSGAMRNDAMGTVRADDAFDFNDILETRLIFDADVKDWKFYGDGRFYLNYGEIAASDGYYRATLMRAFIRYFSPIGDFTLGKTYINFATPGLFNLFAFDKSVTINDLTYDKDGILALEYVAYGGDYFTGKFYGGTFHRDTINYDDPGYCGGFSLGGNAGSFDFGMVVNRIDTDRNTTGVYFKGDAEIGVQGSWAFHVNDAFNTYFNEANFGIDYSFLEGHLIFTLLFYFNERGSTDSHRHTYSEDYYFTSRYYLYGNITTVIDEFISTQVDIFANCIDGSLLIMPSLKWTITDGLSLSFLVPVPVGHNDQEFSFHTSGYLSAIFRVEGKINFLQPEKQ